MEFLIIVFVIISIFSVISKRFKEEAKKKSPFDPWSFDSDSLDDDYNNLNEKEKEKEKAGDFFVEEETPKVDLPKRQPELSETYSKEQSINKYYSSGEPAKGQTSIYKTEVKENDNQITAETSAIGRQLKDLLKGKKLPLAVVASEILGPPKAKKPSSQRNN